MDAREFYADPAMRIAQEAMRQGHAAVPSHDTVDRIHAGRTARQVTQRRATGPRRVAVTTTSRQARAALAGRPVQPLPTRTARKVAAKRRRMIRRLGVAAPVGMIVMIVLLFVIPAVAAVTMGLSVTAVILANVR
jgi:hypothetical protein